MNGSAAAFSNPDVISTLRITTIEKDTPVYIEIYRRLRHLIKTGVLKYGDQLPSEHDLSEIMCVGRTSLRTALSILYEDGYVKIQRGKGSYVMGDNRHEKYKNKSPEGMIFPTERIALLGELYKGKSISKSCNDDEFLNEVLPPAADEKIMCYMRMYYLNGQPAIFSNYYYLAKIYDKNLEIDKDTIDEKLIADLHRKTIVAECECIPVRTIANIDGFENFTGDNHVLVATTYVGEKGPLAYCKDYYNNEVIRFRTTLKKHKIGGSK